MLPAVSVTSLPWSAVEKTGRFHTPRTVPAGMGSSDCATGGTTTQWPHGTL